MTRRESPQRNCMAANLNVDMFFVGRIVREAAVMTYRRAIGPEFSQELEGKRGLVERIWAKASILSPQAWRSTLLQSHNFVLSWSFWVSSSRRLKRETWTPI